MKNQTVMIYGWLYGKMLFLFEKKDKPYKHIINDSMRPVTSFTEMHRQAIQARLVSNSVEKEIMEMLSDIDIEEIEDLPSPEPVIPLEQQGIWDLACSKGRQNTPLRLGYDIAKHRKQAGLTQAELASLMGVSQPAVAKWENGETVLSKESLEKIRDAINSRDSV